MPSQDTDPPSGDPRTFNEGAATMRLRLNVPPSATQPEAGQQAVKHGGERFGDYELIQEIGRGGMGVVFKARQVGLERIVALKMILPGNLASDDELQRFRIEAEATARLQHPNIVTIYEVGEINGNHFYSMDYIEGPSLASRLKDGPLPGRAAAQYTRTIAGAIHHAHRHQILHRDLKPSNILLDADDQPHVTDFGLAKKLGATDSGKTRTGAILGTPSYMAPEQAAGKINELGPGCDVYGLGALLYELLTGRPPFQSESPLDTLLFVMERDPAPPRLLNPKVDHDLETICLKCLEKDPKDRYASADGLAQDLERYLNSESIHARSFNVLDRLSRALDRSQHAFEFRGWGNMVLAFAAIIFIEHFIVFLLTQGPRQEYPLRWIIPVRAAQFVLMGGLFWGYRRSQLLPTTPAERQLWSIWIGYLVACAVVVGAARVPEWRGDSPVDELTLFPVWSALSGLSFFIMGSSYWGRCYVYGAMFFILVLLMPLHLKWAPLEFGLLWAACLTDLGLYLRRLGREERKG